MMFGADNSLVPNAESVAKVDPILQLAPMTYMAHFHKMQRKTALQAVRQKYIWCIK